MQQIIHFIGADNSGKTTIANKLSNILDIPYFKNEYNFFISHENRIGILKAASELEYNLINCLKCSYIRDRSYICEYVYSKVYNRFTDFAYLIELDKLYKLLNLKIIYTFKTQYNTFEDEYVKINEVNKLNKYYREFINKITINNVLVLDTTDEDIEKQLFLINNFLKKENE